VSVRGSIGSCVVIGALAGLGLLSSAAASSAVGAVAKPAASSGYRKIAGFSGTSSKRTRRFTVGSGQSLLVQWTFDCRGIEGPSFAASAFGGSGRDAALSVTRNGRRHASGQILSSANGTFRYRVVSDCAWHIGVYERAVPTAHAVHRSVIADPFSSAAMLAYLRGRAGNISAAVEDVASGKTFLYRPGVAEQTASIVKVDILATLLHQAQLKSTPLDAEQQEIATGMIEDSDNDDATDLWDDVGGASGVAQFNAALGLSAIVPNTQGFWGETMTTAADEVKLLQAVAFANPTLDDASRAYELGLMEHVVGYEHWGVSAGVAANATVALKNGWVPIDDGDWQVNSIGYVDGDGRQYLVAVLTNDEGTEGYGISTIEGISSILWSALGASG
jgi:beta-lactamase class A